jgi:hypothetical protein
VGAWWPPEEGVWGPRRVPHPTLARCPPGASAIGPRGRSAAGTAGHGRRALGAPEHSASVTGAKPYSVIAFSPFLNSKNLNRSSNSPKIEVVDEPSGYNFYKG